MDLLSVFNAALRTVGISGSIHFRKTGDNNMINNPAFLTQAQDTAWNNQTLKATRDPVTGIETTHCNQGALAVARGVGCTDFPLPPAGGEPYTADQLFNFFLNHPQTWFEKDMVDVQTLANAGALVFACLPSWILQEAHGHIVSLTPGAEVWSGSLGMNVPICLNISTIELSARNVGINFAFPMHKATPRFWVWKGSLA